MYGQVVDVICRALWFEYRPILTKLNFKSLTVGFIELLTLTEIIIYSRLHIVRREVFSVDLV